MNSRVIDLKTQLWKLQEQIQEDVMSSEYNTTELRAELQKKTDENAELKEQLQEVLAHVSWCSSSELLLTLQVENMHLRSNVSSQNLCDNPL